MAKPTIQVRTRKRLFAGRTALFEITVTAPDETKINGITATIVGDEGWVVGSGEHQLNAKIENPRKRTYALAQMGVLAAGSISEYQLQIDLPATMAPSHVMTPAWSRLTLDVHIDIPWRIDVRQSFNPVVHHAPPDHVERNPVAVRSAGAADAPRIELALASRKFIVGEELVGTCAVYHLDDSDPRDVELSLVPMLRLFGRREHERRGRPLTSTLTIPKGAAGRGVPFRMAIPRGLAVSFEAPTHTVTWYVSAHSGSMFRGKVDAAVKIELVDSSALDNAERLVAAPRLGDERVARLFATFAAETGWRGSQLDADEHGETAGQFAIETDHGTSLLRIAYDYRGPEGTFLVASIQHRSLGLGLSVTPSSMRQMFFHDIEVDDRAWDRAHHVVARFGDQSILFLKTVVARLTRTLSLGVLQQWTDEVMTLEQSVARVEADQLARIAHDLGSLATVIAEAAAMQISPPPGLAVNPVAWRELATSYATTPSWGDASITGTLGGIAMAVSPVWTEERTIAALHISYGEAKYASDELRATTVALAAPSRDVLGRDVAEALVTLLTGTSLPVRDLRIADGVATVTLPLAPPHSLPADQVRETVELLRACLTALSPATGPYR